MHPSWYIREQKCRWCSGKLVPDKWMNNRTIKPCGCDSYHFPHRMGSMYCQYRKDGTRKQMGDADWHDPHEDRHKQETTCPF